MKKIAVIGTLDTKGEEFLFLKKNIEEKGFETIVIDIAVIDPPYFEPDIRREEVCKAAECDLGELIGKKDRKLSIDTMAAGASKVVEKLYAEGNLDGIISLGGSQGTYMATTAMKVLPLGVPKVMVSTSVAGDMTKFVSYKDITLINSPADILVLNPLNRSLFSQAAYAICAMVESGLREKYENKPLIGVTMFGTTTPCVMKMKESLEIKANLKEAMAVFHARGTGGMAMEELIRDGSICGVMDVTTTELADELVGGIRTAGPDRLDAAGEMGIPQVVAPGALDMVNFGPLDSIPGKFAGRNFYCHTPMATVMRTTVQENYKLGEIISSKLNKSRGETIFLVPKKGFSAFDISGGPFYDEKADCAFIQSLRDNLDKKIKLVEMNYHINDPEFAQRVVDEFLSILKEY